VKQTTYLPHLDGLRAIAVCFVIIYHAGLGLLPGGFIGVDIFFVLSGFLITNQIVNQITNEIFTFKGFYLRRIRRLIPAFATVCLATIGVGYIILLPKDFIYHAKLAVLSFLSVGNFYISNTTKGYFAPQSEEVSLLHTWSLSVEEQYYLIWPLILVLGFKYLGKDRIVPFLVFLFLSSLAFSEWQVMANPEDAYYLMPARFYELLVGSLLAIVLVKLPVLKSRLATLLSIVGTSALVFSAFYLSEDKPFPGLNGVLVCFATATLIYSGMFQSQATNIYSYRLLVGIGKISYSLYLWHWPVFSFMRYVEGSLSVMQIIIAVAISVSLSIISWKYIETPFRERWKYSFKWTFRYLYVLPAILFVAIYLIIDKNDGLANRFDVEIAAISEFEKKLDRTELGCDEQDGDNCLNILLFGDSHAGHFAPFIRALIPSEQPYNFTIKSLGACLPLLDVVTVELKRSGEKRLKSSCVSRNRKVYKAVSDFDYIVLSGFWAMPSVQAGKVFFVEEDNHTYTLDNSLEVFRNALYKSIGVIVEQGGIPVVIKDNPAIGKDLFKCTFKKFVYPSFDSNCRMVTEEVNEQQQQTDEIFSDLAEDFPGIVFINPREVMCSSLNCDLFMDGIPLYRDGDHLSIPGSKLLGEKYLKLKGPVF
jgi:peptidoglycan/LPS O-acetylase OafA/YrhL